MRTAPGHAVRLGDRVEAVVGAVDEVDVGKTGRAVHDGAAVGAAVGVRGGIVGPAVRLGLADQAAQPHAVDDANQPHAEQLPRHGDAVPRIERAGQPLARGLAHDGCA